MKRISILGYLLAALAQNVAHRCPFKKKSPKGVETFEVSEKARAALALAKRTRLHAEKLKTKWLHDQKIRLASHLEDLACDEVRASYSKPEDSYVEFYRGWVCTITAACNKKG